MQLIILISSTSSNAEFCRSNSAKIERIHNRFGEPEHSEAGHDFITIETLKFLNRKP